MSPNCVFNPSAIVFIENDLFTLDFPSREPKKVELPIFLKKSLNILPTKTLKSRDYLLVYKNQNEIENISINTEFFNQINLSPGGVIVTSIGERSDFVSRFFRFLHFQLIKKKNGVVFVFYF